MSAEPMVRVESLVKRFTLHNQGGVSFGVLDGISVEAEAGECVVVNGRSGAGKSTLLRCIYANYRTHSGAARVRHHSAWVDMAKAEPREVLAVRRHTIGYVSQFLRVIPRIPAIDIVIEPLRAQGEEESAARRRAAAVLEKLHVPQRLWTLPPATFSGGEQQRINIARNMIKPKPLLLLDEPTASLDAANTRTVIELIREATARGGALVGIFHDAEVGAAVATRRVNVADFRSVS